MDGPSSIAIAPARAAPPAQAPRQLAEQRSFLSILGRATVTDDAPPARAREAARQLVAQTFIQPMLKQLRSTEQTSALFAPGPGERQFRALMDAELAQRIAGASRFPLVDRVARDLLSQGGKPPLPPDLPHQLPDPAIHGATLDAR